MSSVPYEIVNTPSDELELIQSYRNLAAQAEIDEALQEIRNEVFVFDVPDKRAFEIQFKDDSEISKSIQKKVIEEFLDTTKMVEGNARKILNRFRITTEDVKKHTSLLSPGEFSRLIIAELVAIKPNCIILDEPSNHLDLEVIEELEKGLQEYKGTLIVVSHDRYFVEKLKLNQIFDLDKNSEKIG
jgi:ATPase subunit of ABC transporter with duplicated ATPase domains